MSGSSSAREVILRSIRENLAASVPHDAARAVTHHDDNARPAGIPLPVLPGGSLAVRESAQPDAAPLSRVERFCERMEAAGGRCTVVRNEAAAASALADVLATAGAGRVAVSDVDIAQRLVEKERGALGLEVLQDPEAADLFSCDAGVTSAQWGIAETGSLVLDSASERHRLASLIPPVHVALLPAGRICESLSEAMEQAQGEAPSPAITLITGPSRTADIELTLSIGVHGPQVLHVIVIEDAP